MYARHEFHRLTGTRMEAELLGELWMGRTILLQSTPDSLDGVRGLYSLQKKDTSVTFWDERKKFLSYI